jgi:hypothetical protein
VSRRVEEDVRFVKKCEVCEAQFETRMPHKRFCSRKCHVVAAARRARKRMRYSDVRQPRQCATCGVEFIPRLRNVQKYCCLECRPSFVKRELYQVCCESCGVVFTQRRRRQKCCCEQCQKDVESKKARDRARAVCGCKAKVCVVCGNEFHPDHFGKKYCSEQCRRGAKRLSKLLHRTRDANKETGYGLGHYVYAWFDRGSGLPVYVGKGFGDRAWKEHRAHIRFDPASMYVVILVDGLTEREAYIEECVGIRFLKAMGLDLNNVNDGCVPPRLFPLWTGARGRRQCFFDVNPPR